MAANMTARNASDSLENSVPLDVMLEDYEHPHWLLYYRDGQLPAPKWVHMLTGAFILIIGITGTVGNALLAWAFSCYESLRSPSNLLIANLAIADLSLSLVTFPLLSVSSFAERWLFGKAGCDYYGASAGLFGMLSISTMASIAVDRFFSITNWRKWHLTNRKVYIWIAALWVYSFSLVVPPIFGWSAYILEGIQTSCTFDFLSRTPGTIAFTLYLFFVGFIVPIIVIAICYTLIIRHITRHRKLMATAGFGNSDGTAIRSRTSSAGQSHSRSRTNSSASAMRPRSISATQGDGGRQQRTQMSSEIRAAVTCAVIVILFSLAWTPYAVIALVSTFGHPEIVTPYVNSLPALFAKTNAIYNPIVYALMNERFRNAIWSMVRLRKIRLPGNRNLGQFLRFSSPRGSDPADNQRPPGSRRRFSSRTTSLSLAPTPVSPTVPLFGHVQQTSFDEAREENLGLMRDRNEGPRRTSKDFYHLGQISIPSVIIEERSSAVRQMGSKASLREDNEVFA